MVVRLHGSGQSGNICTSRIDSRANGSDGGGHGEPREMLRIASPPDTSKCNTYTGMWCFEHVLPVDSTNHDPPSASWWARLADRGG
jgi:hypothetical protein